MSSASTPANTPDPPDPRDEFETHWQEAVEHGGEPPDPLSHLPPEGTAEYLQTLRDLVFIDMERRGSSHRPNAVRRFPFLTADEYVRRFPRLGDPILYSSLLHMEQAVRSEAPALTHPVVPDPVRVVELAESVLFQPPPVDRVEIPGYEVVARIGRGGLAEVFRVVCQDTRRELVARRIPYLTVESAARATSEINNLKLIHQAGEESGVIRILKTFKHGGYVYTVMPYYPDGSLEGMIPRGPERQGLPTRVAARLAHDVALALTAVHAKGIIHRDVKPPNLLLEPRSPSQHTSEPRRIEDCRIVLTDFNIALSMDAVARLSGDQVVGSAPYMSPEQLRRSSSPNPAWDIWGLGCVIYEMLTGVPPFSGTTRDEVFERIRRGLPLRPSRVPGVSHHISEQLERICLRCLEADPVNRYQSVAELAEHLQFYIDEEPIPPRAGGPHWVTRSFRWCQANPSKAIVRGVAAVSLAGGIGFAGCWFEADRRETTGVNERAEVTLRGVAERREAALAHPEDDARFARWHQQAVAAVELAGGDRVRSELAKSARDRLREAETTLQSRRLATALDGLYLEMAETDGSAGYTAAIATRYADTFREAGLDADSEWDEATIRVVRESPAAASVATALVTLAHLRGSPAVGRDTQFAKADAIDPDPDRTAFRRATRAGDAKELLALAERGDRLPPASVDQLAEALRLLDEPAAAERVLRAALARHPGDYWVNYRLGWAIHSGSSPRPEEAVRYFAAASGCRPGSAAALVQLGNALTAAGRPAEAIEAFRRATAVPRPSATAFHNLGNMLATLGKGEEALQAFDRAVELRPDYPKAHYHAGNILLARGRLKEAVERFRLGASGDEKRTYNLGVALRLLRRQEAGRAAGADGDEELRVFLGLVRHPQLAGAARAGVLTVLRETRPAAEADKVYAERLGLTPEVARAHFAADDAFRRGTRAARPLEAERHFREVLDLQPDYQAAEYHLGTALAAQNKTEEAIAAFRRGIAQSPDFVEQYVALGDCLGQLGRWVEVLDSHREVVRLRPESAQSHFNLANTYARLQRYPEAVEAFREAVRRRPADPRYIMRLGNALRAVGRQVEAREAFGQAIAVDRAGTLVEARVRLAEVCRSLGKYEDTLAVCEVAICGHPDLPELHLIQGKTLLEMGRFRDALAVFRHAATIRLDPEAVFPATPGPQGPEWWSKEWERLVRECEEFVRLDERAAAALADSASIPAGDVAELAAFCVRHKRAYDAAARLYTITFRADPTLLSDELGTHRTPAARAAILAGLGEGTDAAGLAPAARSAHLAQGVEWLRAEVDSRLEQLRTGGPPAAAARVALRTWRDDPAVRRAGGTAEGKPLRELLGQLDAMCR